MRNPIKRVFDFFLALFGILVSMPLWLFFACVIKASDNGPVFYVQERIGKAKKMFKVIKFRTMPVSGQTVIPTTQMLRNSALDELPQLVNILKGEMSFVGPRPLIKEEIDAMKQEKDYEERLNVRPGLTGTAQLLLPKTATVKEKLLFDIWYIKNYDIMLDIKLIVLSCIVTILGRWELDTSKLAILKSLRDQVQRKIENETQNS